MQEQPVTKKYKQIFKKDIVCIQRISWQGQNITNEVPWKHSFELKTKTRTYVLFAPTSEERDLWVKGLHRIMGVQVNDPSFVPGDVTTKADLEMAESVTMTEGNISPSKNSRSKNNNSALNNSRGLLENVEEEKIHKTSASSDSSRPY